MSLLGSVIGGITGLATGGIGGAIAGWSAGGAIGGPKPPTIAPVAPSMPSLPAVGGGGSWWNQPITIPGVGTAGTIPLGFPGTQPSTGGQCPRGYHLNKHALAASKRHGALPARSICVRNRHLNPMNPRALSRALRREKRARKIVRKLHVFAPVRHTVQRRIGSGRK